MSEDLSALVGKRLAELRTANGARQEDVFEAARSFGLDWTQPTVAAIETGRRNLSVNELVLLPLVLTDALCLPSTLTLADLLTVDRWVQVTDSVAVRPNGLADLIDGGQVSLSPAAPRAVASHRPAEVKAARKLGVSAEALVTAACELWGQSLTAEREERLANGRGNGRGVRGHITRELLDELRPALSTEQVTQ